MEVHGLVHLIIVEAWQLLGMSLNQAEQPQSYFVYMLKGGAALPMHFAASDMKIIVYCLKTLHKESQKCVKKKEKKTYKNVVLS